MSTKKVTSPPTIGAPAVPPTEGPVMINGEWCEWRECHLEYAPCNILLFRRPSEAWAKSNAGQPLENVSCIIKNPNGSALFIYKIIHESTKKVAGSQQFPHPNPTIRDVSMYSDLVVMYLQAIDKGTT